jgi:hypothetical protein
MSSRVLAAAAAFLWLGVSTSHAVTYTRVNQWIDFVVPQSKFNCVSVLPVRPAYAFHRIRLIPKDRDVDLYLYGYNGTWAYVAASAQGGLVEDSVTFTQSTFTTYNAFIACAWGFGGASRFSLYYAVGN